MKTIKQALIQGLTENMIGQKEWDELEKLGLRGWEEYSTIMELADTVPLAEVTEAVKLIADSIAL